MHRLRKLLAVGAATVVAMASGVMVAQADTTPTVYNTPGGQVSGGRLWNTSCEMYSSNVVRCRAEIWATTVQYQNGKYKSVTGWTFNNLSYLPSPRAMWAGNNLGQNNPAWTMNGRKWRTECDTPATGRGGCRSYIWTNQVRWDRGRYISENAWVFNNVVLFSSATNPPVTSVPAWIVDQSRLDVTGLGPVKVGTPMPVLGKLGYAEWITGEACEYWAPSPKLQDRGVELWASNDLVAVQVFESGVLTVDGAHVGMTLSEVKAIYGARLTLETKEGYQPVYTAVVKRDGYELVFMNGFELNRPLKNTDVIKMIIARKGGEPLLWDGC